MPRSVSSAPAIEWPMTTGDRSLSVSMTVQTSRPSDGSS